MVQLSIHDNAVPDCLTFRIHQDPFDPACPVGVTAQVWAVDGTLIAAHHIALRGLEVDFLDSVVRAVVECWQWGSPQSQVPYVMRRIHTEAKKHRKAHAGR